MTTAPPFHLVADTPGYLVIDKAPGVEFHKGRGEAGLAERVRQAFGIPTLFPVHRLDTVTSGLLLFAKTHALARELAAQFASHTVERYYLGIGVGRPVKTQGAVRGDLERTRGGAWLLRRTTRNPALTYFFSAGLGDGLRLFLLKPVTGKSHQLRVTMKALASPVLGDPLYGRARPAQPTPGRAYLHAWSLGFRLGETFHRYSCLPNEGELFNTPAVRAILEKWKEPWALPWPAPPHASVS